MSIVSLSFALVLTVSIRNVSDFEALSCQFTLSHLCFLYIVELNPYGIAFFKYTVFFLKDK